jgi:hypothetical protein
LHVERHWNISCAHLQSVQPFEGTHVLVDGFAEVTQMSFPSMQLEEPHVYALPASVVVVHWPLYASGAGA